MVSVKRVLYFSKDKGLLQEYTIIEPIQCTLQMKCCRKQNIFLKITEIRIRAKTESARVKRCVRLGVGHTYDQVSPRASSVGASPGANTSLHFLLTSLKLHSANQEACFFFLFFFFIGFWSVFWFSSSIFGLVLVFFFFLVLGLFFLCGVCCWFFVFFSYYSWSACVS